MTMTRQRSVRSVIDKPGLVRPSIWRWQQHSFRAMNTGVHVWRYGRDDKPIADVETLFAQYERNLSRFSPDAELAQLNRSGLACQHISQPLFDALTVALQAAYATDGLYDPTILGALEQAGYDRSFEQIADTLSDDQPQESIGPKDRYSFRDVHLDPQTCEIRKPAGLGLDLGGMGKGWTVDRAADNLIGEGPFLINAGGDLYAYGAPGSAEGWEIQLEHPLNPGWTLTRLSLHDRALATSTITKRRWRHHGKAMHHLIDPRSGEPVQTDALSVSVVADRTVLAEIYAKVALILGAQQGLTYLQSLPNVAGMIYRDDGRMLFTDAFCSLLS